MHATPTMLLMSLLAMAPAANAGKARPAKGPAYRSADDGFSLRAPKGFAISEDGARVFARGEGVTIAAQFHADLRYDAMETYCAGAAQLVGTGYGQAGAPSRWKAPAGRAIAMDFTGPPTLPIRSRAIGIAGKRGALVMLGWTSGQDGPSADELTRLVDSVASSVRFFKPKSASPNRRLVGTWWTGGGKTTRSVYSKNRSHRSHERKVTLCPSGRFHDFSQSDVTLVLKDHVDTGGGASSSNAYGRWSATGTGTRGTVVMRFDDGRRLRIPFQLQGGTGVFGGVRFSRGQLESTCGAQ